MASKGNLNKNLLEELNGLPFYNDDQPKSLGYEYIEDVILPMIDNHELPVEDILRTFVEHVAIQIANVVNINRTKNLTENMLVTGGGAFNNFLIDRLRKLSKVEIVIPDKEIIDFKEALVFALLGVLKDQNEVNCLKSVTGANEITVVV